MSKKKENKILGRSAFLKAAKAERLIEDVNIMSMGGIVRIARMNAGEKTKYEIDTTRFEDDGKAFLILENIIPARVACSVVDEKGELVFESIEEVQALPPDVVTEIHNHVKRLNPNLEGVEKEELEKNSDASPSEGSSSD